MATLISQKNTQPFTGIYMGKFTDRNPDLTTAGKLTVTGDSITSAMKPKPTGRTSPEPVRRMRGFFDPSAGFSRVHYGRAYDPHRKWASDMTHGVTIEPSGTAREACNPDPKTRFRQRMQDKKESIYFSNKKGPLGTVAATHGGLPGNVDPVNSTFGMKNYKDAFAGESINPPQNFARIERDEQEYHNLYRGSHRNYYPGEQLRRNYTMPNFDSTRKYGMPTPHFNDGRHAKETTRWLTETMKEKGDKIVSKRLEDFREKTQPQLGKVHDPIKDTLKVTLDHTFGILQKPDEYGAGDLIHSRHPGAYLRGKERIRGIVSAIRQHLKKANYQNFDSLLNAFRFYDKANTGRIGMKELQAVCAQFNLPTDAILLNYVMDFCDVNKDGVIDYQEFVNFLNWQDKMPSGLPPVEDDRTRSAPGESPRLAHQIDERVTRWNTSASMINARSGIGGISTHGYRTYGVPTVRCDLSAPRFKRVSDRVNYGDESDAYGLLNPHVFAERGVHEQDFLTPRSKMEIREIFEGIGVRMTLDDFDKAWAAAAAKSPKGQVCVESFRNTLDEAQVKMNPQAYA